MFLSDITRARDAAVQQAMDAYAHIGQDAVQARAFEQSADIWTDKMSCEVTFNVTKHADAKLAALDAGLLLPSEIGVWDAELADGRRKHKLELQT